MVKYTDEMKKFIAENVDNTLNKELAEMVNKKFGTNISGSAISSYKYKLGLKSGIDSKFKKNSLSGKKSTFKTGHKPWNKGIKGWSAPGTEKTRFVKGNIPQNHRPVGSERISKDGYIEIKVAERNKWELKHRMIWEQINGPIPSTHVLIFLDGDKSNIALENLKLIHRRELLVMNRHKLFSDNNELTEMGNNVANLIIAMENRKNRNCNKRLDERMNNDRNS